MRVWLYCFLERLIRFRDNETSGQLKGSRGCWLFTYERAGTFFAHTAAR
jgi:hypothetical protein